MHSSISNRLWYIPIYLAVESPRMICDYQPTRGWLNPARLHLQPSRSSLDGPQKSLISSGWWIDLPKADGIVASNYQWVGSRKFQRKWWIWPTSLVSGEGWCLGHLHKICVSIEIGPVWALEVCIKIRRHVPFCSSANDEKRLTLRKNKKNWESYAGVDIFVQGSCCRSCSTQKSIGRLKIGEHSLSLHDAVSIHWHNGRMGSHVILIIPCVTIQIDQTKPDHAGSKDLLGPGASLNASPKVVSCHQCPINRGFLPQSHKTIKIVYDEWT